MKNAISVTGTFATEYKTSWILIYQNVYKYTNVIFVCKNALDIKELNAISWHLLDQRVDLAGEMSRHRSGIGSKRTKTKKDRVKNAKTKRTTFIIQDYGMSKRKKRCQDYPIMINY